MIRGQMFSRAIAPIGQHVQTMMSSTSHSFVVPLGVTRISVVLVAASSGHSLQLKRGATILLSDTTALGAGVGGGNGGANGGSSDGAQSGGGGGAGGYSGAGGAGAYANRQASPGSYYAAAGSPGAGGGGGGAGCNTSGSGGRGGGVGLLGTGNNGAGGASGGGAGGHGSQRTGSGAYGGGINNGGGKLRYLNDITVTPGETLTIAGSAGGGMIGAARIMWGGGRSYPSNALDM